MIRAMNTNTAAEAAQRSRPFDLKAIRRDFPILSELIHGKPLAYLDNAATTQKPQVVIDALHRYYAHDNANIHRGVHLLSQRATDAYEAVREKARRFLNAPSPEEIIFVRGTTEAINLVAQSFGRSKVRAGDEVVISAMEHHSDIVPWQLLCEGAGALLKVVPMNERGELDLGALERLLTPRTRILAVVHLSNALGTLNPIQEIVRIAHARGVPVLVDGAQSSAHVKIDVQALGCDFFAFSGHKIYGPTGVGVLWGRKALLEAMPPWQGGGDMILQVTFEKTTYNRLPYKFEAGTPNIADVIALGAAIDYLSGLGLEAVAAHEAALFDHAVRKLGAIEGLRFIGTAAERASVLSFVLEGIHPHDIGTILDREGIAVRAGHHCAQPTMAFFGVDATARASLAVYNTAEEIDRLAAGLQRVKEVFA
jgi:cysteine desulfurase / selenocysteine lyase